jgi:hypothetical protein
LMTIQTLTLQDDRFTLTVCNFPSPLLSRTLLLAI